MTLLAITIQDVEFKLNQHLFGARRLHRKMQKQRQMIAILDTKTFRKHKQVEVMLVGQFKLGRHQHWLATQLIIAQDRGEVFNGPLVREGSARLDV